MASSENPKVAAILRDFESALEDLTFNSKPLINDLTMAAEKYKPIANSIVKKIEERVLEVHPNHTLPSLYLMDSIMKNIGGEYVDLFSRNIVQLFCKSFEKLTDPKSRISLYKLRQTWNSYISHRKLAAIDKHVHALDPAWPVTATDTSPASPSIFVNPKFLEADNVQKDSVQKKPKKTDSPPKPKKTDSPPKAFGSGEPAAPSPKEGVVMKMGDGLSVQEMRRQLLEKKRLEKREQQKAMGLSTTDTTATKDSHLSTKTHKRGLTPPASQRGLTPPASQSTSLKLQPKKTKARSVSPNLNRSPQKASPRKEGEEVKGAGVKGTGVKGAEVKGATVKGAGVNHVKGRERVGVLAGTKHELNQAADGEAPGPPVEKRPRVEKPQVQVGETQVGTIDMPLDPIKSTHLQLDDVPPELLPKHHECMLKRVEKQLKSGNLTEEQHSILVEQLEKLYELQKQKEAGRKPGQQQQQETGTDSRDPNRSQSVFTCNSNSLVLPHSVSSSDGSATTTTSTSIARTHTQNSSTFDKADVNVHRDLGPPQFQHHRPHHLHHPPPPPPPHPHPVHDRYPGRPRGGRRSRFRGRGPPRRGSGRYYNRPPPFERHSPPPHSWEPMETDNSALPPPPPKAGGPPDQLHVVDLFNKLIDFGIITENQEESRNGQQKIPSSSVPQRSEPSGPTDLSFVPLNIPNLTFTVATLKQCYGSLISLLHAGEQCASCGLRFISRSGSEYRDHLDWHYRMNRKESEGKRKSSRNWFIHPEDWLTFDEVAAEGEEKELTVAVEPVDVAKQSDTMKEEEPSSCKVLPGEGNDEVCDICEEPFEQFWEEDLEEWHFKDAVRAEDSKSGTLDHSGSHPPHEDQEHKPPD